MSDFTFLTEKQAYGENKLEILKKYKKACQITDFATLCYGKALECEDDTYYTDWSWWTKDFSSFLKTATVISKDGKKYERYMNDNRYGGRPAISFSSIKSMCNNMKRNSEGILEVEYGNYPQQVVDEETTEKLEKTYWDSKLKRTGNSYGYRPYWFLKWRTQEMNFEWFQLEEYEYDGKRYVRMFMDRKDNSINELSNNQNPGFGKIVWLEVSPIKWLVDEKEDIALSEKIIFSGAAFHTHGGPGSFMTSDIKVFMDECFSKDIVLGYEKNKISEGQRPGIRVSNINVEKIQEVVKVNDLEQKENSKVKRK